MRRLVSFYLENDLMTGNTFFTFLMWYTVLLFRRFYFSHEKMCVFLTWTIFLLLFLHLIVCQILSKRNTTFNSTGRKLWTRFVKFDTFVYSHLKNSTYSFHSSLLGSSGNKKLIKNFWNWNKNILLLSNYHLHLLFIGRHSPWYKYSGKVFVVSIDSVLFVFIWFSIDGIPNISNMISPRKIFSDLNTHS